MSIMSTYLLSQYGTEALFRALLGPISDAVGTNITDLQCFSSLVQCAEVFGEVFYSSKGLGLTHNEEDLSVADILQAYQIAAVRHAAVIELAGTPPRTQERVIACFSLPSLQEIAEAVAHTLRENPYQAHFMGVLVPRGEIRGVAALWKVGSPQARAQLAVHVARIVQNQVDVLFSRAAPSLCGSSEDIGFAIERDRLQLLDGYLQLLGPDFVRHFASDWIVAPIHETPRKRSTPRLCVFQTGDQGHNAYLLGRTSVESISAPAGFGPRLLARMTRRSALYPPYPGWRSVSELSDATRSELTEVAARPRTGRDLAYR